MTHAENSKRNAMTQPEPSGRKQRLRKWLVLLVATAAIVAVSVGVATDHRVFVGRRTSGTVPLHEIDHSRWNVLLNRYVDADGMVNYRAWHANDDDTRLLDEYLEILSEGDRSRSTADGRLAFWINAYNAVTIRGILMEYPTSSIREHTAPVAGYNIWKHLQLFVGDQPHSLEGIEHGILRPTNDPRIHFAIVCASTGCPRLLNEAYFPDRVQSQLEENARDFFRRRQNFQFDSDTGRFYLSELFSWFGTDFGSDQASQLKTMAQWLPTENAMRAAESNAVQIHYLDYDWSLNEQR